MNFKVIVVWIQTHICENKPIGDIVPPATTGIREIDLQISQITELISIEGGSFICSMTPPRDFTMSWYI